MRVREILEWDNEAAELFRGVTKGMSPLGIIGLYEDIRNARGARNDSDISRMDVTRGLGKDTLMRIINSNITDYGEKIDEDMIIEEVEEILRKLQKPLYQEISRINDKHSLAEIGSMFQKKIHESYAEIRGINKVAEALGLELGVDDDQDDVDPTPLEKGPR